MAYFEQRKDGWRVQIRRRGMPTLSRTFDLKADAEAWACEVKVERAAQRGDINALDQQAQRVTVSEVLEQYESQRLPQLRGQAGTASRLMRIRERFGAYFLGNVRSVDVAAWRDEMLRVRADSNLSHRADPILSQGWKPTF